MFHPKKERKKLQSNPLLITFINDQIKCVLVVKHISNLEIGGYQKTWFLKYVSTDQDHFQMEHGIKTGGKHQHTFMLLTWPVYAELKS